MPGAPKIRLQRMLPMLRLAWLAALAWLPPAPIRANWLARLIRTIRAALLAWPAWQARGARADVLPIDDARPWVASGGAPVDWTTGGGAFLLASSPAVRLNYRGVTTEPRGAVLRDLVALGWTCANCNLSARGLCVSEVGTAFPPPGAPAPRATDDPGGRLPPDWAGLRCGDAAGRVLTHAAVYDLSACDVLDEGADVLYSAGRLCLRRGGLAPWAYWALIVGAILLVRGLARNVQAHRERGSLDSQRLPLAASALCVLLVSHDGGAGYATEADYTFYVATMLYCLCYLGYHAAFVAYGRAAALALALGEPPGGAGAPGDAGDTGGTAAAGAPGDTGDTGDTGAPGDAGPGQPPIFNLAAGVLQLIASRLYAGAESPYNPIILLILCTRAVTKLRQPSAGHALTGLLDASYIALACELGFTPDPAYLVALFACASLVSQLYFAQGVEGA